MNELSAQQLEQNYQLQKKLQPVSQTISTPQNQKKTKNRGGGLTAWLSEGGAVGGAALGTMLLPGVGTVIGGGLGGLLGKLAENKIRDDEYRLGEAATEGAISGVLGVGGKGIKATIAATKELFKPARQVTKELVNPAVGDLNKITKGLKNAEGSVKVGADGMPIATATGTQTRRAAAAEASRNVYNKPGILSKTKKAVVTEPAKDVDMRTAGIEIGGTVKGRLIDAKYADELYDFARNGSKSYIKGGVSNAKPITQAKEASQVFQNVNKELENQLFHWMN